MANSWVPQALLAFVEFCKKWKAVLNNSEYLTAFGWVQQAVTKCLDAITGFLTALDTWEANDSSLNKALRDDARKAAENAIEHFAAHQVQYNELMSETEKLELLGVRTWHQGHPITVPGTVPELNTRAGHVCQVIVDYRDLGSTHWGKPAKVHCIEICWAFLDHPPKDIKELINSAVDTSHPFKKTFGEEDRGKTVYFAGRWEINREGLKGDFGPIVSAIVP
ncbi:MAG: hypothetical protein LBK63_00515 [Treponema sp.]|jgi:hypothetical protein|nr:hypothetical protein [Treponema sp.]